MLQKILEYQFRRLSSPKLERATRILYKVIECHFADCLSPMSRGLIVIELHLISPQFLCFLNEMIIKRGEN